MQYQTHVATMDEATFRSMMEGCETVAEMLALCRQYMSQPYRDAIRES